MKIGFISRVANAGH